MGKNSDFRTAIFAATTKPIPCLECGGHKLELDIGKKSVSMRCLECGRLGEKIYFDGPIKQSDRNGAIIRWNTGRTPK